MVAAIDIWRTAKLVIEQHKQGAQLHAARRISELTMQRDQAGAAVWSEILAAIVVLTSAEPPDSLPRH